FQPERIVPVGSFPAGLADLERRLGMKPVPPLEWSGGRPAALWKGLFPRAAQVRVCPTEPRRLLPQAGRLAGPAQAPRFVGRGEGDEAGELRRCLAGWQTGKVFAAGPAAELCKGLGKIHVVPLADEEAVAAAHRRQLHVKGPIQTLVVANPADNRNGL